jgi:hypothetical protein
MIVKAISGYLATGNPCLHLHPDFQTGAYINEMLDANSVIITIWEEEYRKHDGELDFLMNTPIEFGVYEKNNHVLPIVKIGPSDNPYLYTLPFDPVLPENQRIIDLFTNSRMIVVAFVEGEKEKDYKFRGIRVLGITDEMKIHLVNKWADAIEQGMLYSYKYIDFLKSSPTDPMVLWDRSVYLGEFEE